jgi:hypothetical protein
LLRDTHSHTITPAAIAANDVSETMMTKGDIQSLNPDGKYPDTAKLVMFICYY